MRGFTVLALLLVATGCGGKKTKGSTIDLGDVEAEHVEIDLSDEEAAMDELDGIELTTVTEECGEFLELEPAARLGRLAEPQIRCLTESLGTAERQTVKDKLSRVLLADAWAKGDIHRWMGICARHLAEIERSDPDLVYQFAYQLVQAAPAERMDEAIHWADVALENKVVWEGETYVRRVYGLYKLRTMAALRKWESLEAKYRSKPTDSVFGESERARNETKTFAREWLEYAKSSGRDVTEPQRLCSMAAGTDEFCAEG